MLAKRRLYIETVHSSFKFCISKVHNVQFHFSKAQHVRKGECASYGVFYIFPAFDKDLELNDKPTEQLDTALIHENTEITILSITVNLCLYHSYYRQTPNISSTLVGNEIVDHSDVGPTLLNSRINSMD